MRAIISVFAMLAMSGTAVAGCFSGAGCTDREFFTRADLRRLSCDDLWFIRNTIYDEAGLCFRTADAQAQFDNSDCTVRNPANVKLNRFERANIETIRQVEQRKGCDR